MTDKVHESAHSRVPVSRRALVQRINRRLAQDGRKLVAARVARSFYIVGLQSGAVEASDITDLEGLARTFNALALYECVAH